MLLPLLRRGRRGPNIRAYRHYIAPHLDAETRGYWQGSGRGRPPAHRALRAQCLPPRPARPLHRRRPPAGPALRRRPRRLHEGAQSIARAARASSTASWRRCSTSRLVRWLTRRPASLFGLGIPPAQYRELQAGRRRRHALRCCGPGSSGWPAAFRFATIISPGRPSTAAMPQAAAARCRPISSRTSIPASASRPSRVEVKRISMTRALAAMDAG